MNVERPATAVEPSYPSRWQFSSFQLLVGVAAIGMGAAMGRAGDPPRLRGEMQAEPRDPKPATIKPVATLGLVRADPGGNCAATNAPPVVTNRVPPVAVAIGLGRRLAAPATRRAWAETSRRSRGLRTRRPSDRRSRE